MSTGNESRAMVGYISEELLRFQNEGRITQEFPLKPVGLVVYDGGGKGVFIGLNERNNGLVAVHEDLPDGFRVNDFLGWRGRTLLLSHIQEITVGQLRLGEVEIERRDSLRESDLIETKIRFNNLTEEGSSEHIVSLDDTLGFMTSAGRIGLFTGEGLAEDHALVFQESVGNRWIGKVLFSRPAGIESVAGGQDAMLGLGAFYKGLNEGLRYKVPSEESRHWLHILEDNIERDYIQFDDPVRLEIFRAMVIANAHLLGLEKVLAKQELYSAWLKNHLISLSWKDRLLWGPPKKDVVEQVRVNANSLVDKVIISNSDLSTNKTPPIGVFTGVTEGLGRTSGVFSPVVLAKKTFDVYPGEQSGRETWKMLKTEAIRDMRKEMKTDGGRVISIDDLLKSGNTKWSEMGIYLTELYNHIAEAPVEEIGDLEVLIGELESWEPSSREEWQYNCFPHPTTRNPIVSFGPHHHPTVTLDRFLTEARRNLNKKRYSKIEFLR